MYMDFANAGYLLLLGGMKLICEYIAFT